jgi:aryl-alcohol dehydrogenase-like predicted oxidoreductase
MNYLVNSAASETTSRLVLGTAQLGMPYGIANRTGKPDFETAVSLIKTAWEHGIREFDTAQAYGESEAILGRAFAALGISNDARIITKLDSKFDPQGQHLKRAVDLSLERLQIPTLYGLMLHREDWLDHLSDGLEETLRALVVGGTVRHLGVSLYTPAKALRALESEILEMIQVPANILDRRFANAGVFKLADEKGKQVYIRSVFLQGLLLMSPDELPFHMAFIKPTLGKIDSLCEQYNYTPQKAALLYIKAKYPRARIIFGAESLAQLEQNLNIWKDNLTSIDEINEFNRLSIADERILNPSFW